MTGKSVPTAAGAPMPQSDEALRRATGEGWDHWLGLLDGWDARNRSHTEIARWLAAEQGVDGWWSQAITVGYERARGMRAPGQRPDGFSVSATRTVAVGVEELYDAFTIDSRRSNWLPDTNLRERTATRPRSARYDWDDGATRVIAGFEPAGEGRSRIAVEHERLPDAEAAERMKHFWRERLTALKRLLEGG